MRTTGIFTTHYYPIKNVEVNKPIYLLPFGDVHKYSHMHDKTHWANFLKWAKDKERAYFLGMGDYFDLASTSERQIIHDGRLHESTINTFDELALGYVLKMAKELEFMTGRLIGLIEGNHYYTFQNDGKWHPAKSFDVTRGHTISEGRPDPDQIRW